MSTEDKKEYFKSKARQKVFEKSSEHLQEKAKDTDNNLTAKVFEKASEVMADKAADEKDKQKTLGTDETAPASEPKRKWRLRFER